MTKIPLFATPLLLLCWGCTNLPAGPSDIEASQDSTKNEATAQEEPSVAQGDTNGDGCPAELFLDVAAEEGPGGNYPAPELNVTCTDTHMTVTSNGITHYPYENSNPNDMQAQNHSWTIPLNPQVADAPTEIPLLGDAGFAINGIPFYGPNEAEFPDPYGDPVFNGIMDACAGHPGGQNDYHYHSLLVHCLSAGGLDQDIDRTRPSPIIGFALDGFPIYGPMGCLDEDCTEVVEFKSGWELTVYESPGCESSMECSMDYACGAAIIDGEVTTACGPKDYVWNNSEFIAKDDDTFLDECNGRMGPDGTYRYYATTTFPYILGCYTGTPNSAGGNGPGGNNGGGNNGGGNNGGGNNDGEGEGECETDDDCVTCGEAQGQECICAQAPAPVYSVCAPTCDTDDDCPDDVPTCAQGVCRPGRVGGGGGGGGPS